MRDKTSIKVNTNILKSVVLVTVFFSVLQAFAWDRPFSIVGRVRESTFQYGLYGAKVYGLDKDGNRVDSATVTEMSPQYVGMNVDPNFDFITVRDDSVHILEFVYPGYEPKILSFTVKDVANNERYRMMDVVYLDKESLKLSEVTVNMSKVKFYNRGDTLVYNADAFRTPAGSMLDGLLMQMPGLTITPEGQIKYNGEFVETLLLNGRQFFGNNKSIMLNNLAAMMVKQVEVYRGHNDLEKWLDDGSVPTHLTMDVKLRKQYSHGLIANIQGGYGTEDRYLGRLFLSRFTPRFNVTLLGNINNLNDRDLPRRNRQYTPQSMPSGLMTSRMAGLTIDYSNPKHTHTERGSIEYHSRSIHGLNASERTNFFSSGNTFDYSRSDSRSKETRVNLKYELGWNVSRALRIGSHINANYNLQDQRVDGLSASYYEEQASLAEALAALYSDGSDENLYSVINRSSTRSDSRTRSGSFDGQFTFHYKIPKLRETFILNLTPSFITSSVRTWNDYNITYPDAPARNFNRRNYTNGNPNHDFKIWVCTGPLRLPKYNYEFRDVTKDSYTYALDRLADMGIYGTLPDGFAMALDPSNSYSSREIDNRHYLSHYFKGSWKVGEHKTISFNIIPKIGFEHRSLTYFSDGVPYLVSKNSPYFDIYSTYLRFAKGERAVTRLFTAEYGITTNTTAPDLLHFVDVINTADPLNYMLGNPGLKTAYNIRQRIKLEYEPLWTPLHNELVLEYKTTVNSLIRGYTYDTSTGIRRNRTYNVQGNRSFTASDNLRLQFGTNREFTLASATEAAWIRAVDMVGLNVPEPSPSTAITRNLGENVSLE